MRFIKFTLFLFVFSTLMSCSLSTRSKVDEGQNKQLSIYAAAGTRAANEELAKQFTANEACAIVANYASSGTLARQIANGAECDIFISANKQWIDFLLEKDVLLANSVQVIARSSLVVITPLNSAVIPPVFSAKTDAPTPENENIAIGNPESVPVGKYTKMVFDSLGCFDKLSPNLVLCKDVSSVRHYVELGECNWGIVYYTEAVQSKKIKIVYEIPEELHQPINFYLAIHKNANLSESEKYIEFISSFKGQEILENFGFITDEE